LAKLKGIEEAIKESKRRVEEVSEAVIINAPEDNEEGEEILAQAKSSLAKSEALLQDTTDLEKEKTIRDQLVKQLNSLKLLLVESQKTEEERNVELEVLENRIKQLSECIKKLNKSIKSKKRNSPPCLRCIDASLGKELEEKKEELARVKEDRRIIKEELIPQERARQELIQASIAELAELQKNIEELIEKKQMLEKSLRAANIDPELSQVVKKKEELAKKYESLTAKLTELTKSLLSKEELEQEIAALQNQKEEYQQVQIDYENKLKELKEATINNDKCRKECEENKAGEKYRKFQEAKKNADNKLQEIEKHRAKTLEENLTRIRQNYHAAQAKITELEEIIRSSAEPAEVERLLQAKETEIKKVSTDKSAAEAQVAELTKKVKKLEAKVETTQTDLESAGKNVEEKSEVNESLSKKIAELEAEISELRSNQPAGKSEQQILQKEKYEFQCQIIDELNKQLTEAKHNLSLAKTYLTETRADLATSQETVVNLTIEKRKDVLKFSAEVDRLKAKIIEVDKRFATATEKNIELSEQLKKEEERNSNFHDEVVKLKEKLANQEVELKNKKKDAKGKEEKEIIAEKDGEENTSYAKQLGITEETKVDFNNCGMTALEITSSLEFTIKLTKAITTNYKCEYCNKLLTDLSKLPKLISLLRKKMLSRESFLNKYFKESYKKIKRDVEKIFEEIEKKDKENKRLEKAYFEFKSINKMIEMVDANFKPETKLNLSEQEIDNLEKNLSTQNTTPQPLTEEECKICPIKEAKIAELKTSLDQANQD